MRSFARLIVLFVFILSIAMPLSAQLSGQRSGPVGVRHEIFGKITNDADHLPMANVAIRLSTEAGFVLVIGEHVEQMLRYARIEKGLVRLPHDIRGGPIVVRPRLRRKIPERDSRIEDGVQE